MATPAANIPSNLLTPPFHQIVVDRDDLFNNRSFRDDVCNYPVMHKQYFYNPSLLESEENSISENDQTILPHTKSFVKYFQKFDKGSLALRYKSNIFN